MGVHEENDMSDTTTHDENCETCGRPLKESRDFKSLRAEVESVTTERDELKSKLLNRTIRDAGFDPEVGIVKRLAKEFDGELDAEAFKSFAVAEGLTPAEPPTDTETKTKTETEQQLDRLQAPGDRLREQSTQQTSVADTAQQIADLEAAGKWTEAGRLKRQLQAERKAG